MNSIREQIIQSIITNLKEIKTVNGYQTDMGKTVERARTHWEISELPVLSVFPGVESSEVVCGARINTMPVAIVGNELLSAGENPSVKAEKMLADLISNILGPTFIYEGLMDRIEYISGGPENYPEPGEEIVSVRTLFNFIYTVKNNNPYLQP